MIYGEKFLNNQIVDEGATSDYISISKKYKAIYKQSMQNGQKKYKNGDYKGARKEFSNALDACDAIEKEYKKICNDNAISVVTGAMAHILYKFGIDIILGCLLLCVGIQLISIDLNAPARAINLIKKWDKNNISKSANLYRNDIEYGLKSMRNSAMSWIKVCGM